MFSEDELSLLYELFQLKASAFGKIAIDGTVCNADKRLASVLFKNGKKGRKLVRDAIREGTKNSRFTKFVKENRTKKFDLEDIKSLLQKYKAQFLLENDNDE